MQKSLFDNVNIGPVTLHNRFVRSATWEGMCDEHGAATAKLVNYYRTLARGGVGLIISGYTYVREDGKQLPGKMGLYSDALIPQLKELTDAVHQENGLVFCQLVHAGGQSSVKVTGVQPLAPSAADCPFYAEPPRAMTLQDINEIVAAFGAAAGRARQAGFDGVQLHGAHAYLINQFLSPLSNLRNDRYGGGLAGRMLFLEEVYHAVRAAVGADFPVTIKLTATDQLEGGFRPEEGVAVACRLEELGIDAIEVSSGTPASGKLSPVRQSIDSPDLEAYNAEYATAVKDAVRVPVITVGGLRSCGVMQRLLWNSQADLFAMSRPLIREADLPRKWQDDDSQTATCISCNGCFKPGLKEGGIYCIIDKIERDNRDSQL